MPLSVRYLLFALLPLLLTLGCGSGNGRKPVYSVQGQAFRGTEPLVGAMVVFHPTTIDEKDLTRPTGLVGEDGSFQLTTYENNDGAWAGDYNVTILWNDKSKEKGGGLITESKAIPTDKLKGAYADPKNPKLKAHVDAGPTNKVRLEVNG